MAGCALVEALNLAIQSVVVAALGRASCSVLSHPCHHAHDHGSAALGLDCGRRVDLGDYVMMEASDRGLGNYCVVEEDRCEVVAAAGAVSLRGRQKEGSEKGQSPPYPLEEECLKYRVSKIPMKTTQLHRWRRTSLDNAAKTTREA